MRTVPRRLIPLSDGSHVPPLLRYECATPIRIMRMASARRYARVADTICAVESGYMRARQAAYGALQKTSWRAMTARRVVMREHSVATCCSRASALCANADGAYVRTSLHECRIATRAPPILSITVTYTRAR